MAHGLACVLGQFDDLQDPLNLAYRRTLGMRGTEVAGGHAQAFEDRQQPLSSRTIVMMYGLPTTSRVSGSIEIVPRGRSWNQPFSASTKLSASKSPPVSRMAWAMAVMPS
jgi:hypothetical protein